MTYYFEIAFAIFCAQNKFSFFKFKFMHKIQKCTQQYLPMLLINFGTFIRKSQNNNSKPHKKLIFHFIFCNNCMHRQSQSKNPSVRQSALLTFLQQSKLIVKVTRKVKAAAAAAITASADSINNDINCQCHHQHIQLHHHLIVN